jgi:hypothetical protein
MSRYYAEVSGAGSSSVTKTGTPKSGMVVHARDWSFGVRIQLEPDPANPTEDRLTISISGGSTNPLFLRRLFSDTQADAEKLLQ